ncbi:uncharacterized protein [Battus philenor]|uniref:uncharacterized protein n=1 Tax=Battus philenor TaxID=42288 RepID=UPI0035D09804
MSLRPLINELAEVARSELNEDPKRINDDLQHIKEWLSKQPHLSARMDDQWLIAFLRGCKYSLERTKEKLDLYYSIRGTAPELFRIKHNEPLFNEILDLGANLVLPKVASPSSPRVSIIKPGNYNPDKYTIADIISVANTIDKISLMEDDNYVVAGGQFILDLDGVTMSHFLQMTPTTIKKMVVSSQDAMPLRMKGTHYLNTPTGFETVFNAVKSLLNEKNQNRLYVHNKNYDELYKHIPKDILPVEYGGKGGTIKEIIEYWKRKVQEYDEFLEEDYRYGTNEAKRRGTPKTAESMFGEEGSFRQLNLELINMPVRPLTPELAEKALLELNETDSQKMEDSIQHLKEWIAKQPHLRARTDDQWLAAFLRGCKFSLERSKQKIDLFYSMKKWAPELGPLKYSDPKFMEIHDLGIAIILPKTNKPADPRVMLMRPGVVDPNKYSITEMMSINLVIQNLLLMEDDNFVVAGGVSIMDFQGASMAHFTQMTPMLMKKMTTAFQEATPIRMKGAHYLNTPPGFETLFNFMKNFLNEKNKKRLYVHNTDFESLYKYVPKEILPAEYGGNAGTIQELLEISKKNILKYSAWLDEEEKFGTDESKRPGKPRTAEDIFGVEGSFRQLQFD